MTVRTSGIIIPGLFAGEPCARVRLFRKPVPAGREALVGDHSSFFRGKKKSIRRHLGFLLDREEKTDEKKDGLHLC